MSFFKRIFAKKTKEIGQEVKKPAVIERMTAPNKIRASDTLRIVVSGHFSNLGWSLDKAEAHIQNKDIIISVIGKRKTGMMSAQALKPYETTVEVKRLKKGKYKIIPSKGPASVLELEVRY